MNICSICGLVHSFHECPSCRVVTRALPLSAASLLPSAASPPPKPKVKSRFCYWSVADGEHGKMIRTTVTSARRNGVTEDFHIWSDIDIPGADVHKSGIFSKEHYLFKFKFLLNEVSKLDYEYFVWLDADNYFVRHPGDGIYDRLLRQNKWFVQLESNCTSKFVKRGDWWGCPIKWYPLLLKYHGVSAKTIYNCNAGFWVVRKEAIQEFYKKTTDFFDFCRNEMELLNFTEEAPLAYVGHFVDDPELNNFAATQSTWACDWTGWYSNRLPDGKEWDFEDYMSGEKKKVNSAIVHCMRSKDALVRGI